MRTRRPAALPSLAALAVALLAPTPAAAQAAPGTPAEMIATYNAVADAILAVKRTEADLVRSILATAYGHGQAQLARASAPSQPGDAAAATAATGAFAADVAQLATEGDNHVAVIRRRLIEGGHHNSADEAQGVLDEGLSSPRSYGERQRRMCRATVRHPVAAASCPPA
jgi:hypothetical protein